MIDKGRYFVGRVLHAMRSVALFIDVGIPLTVNYKLQRLRTQKLVPDSRPKFKTSSKYALSTYASRNISKEEAIRQGKAMLQSITCRSNPEKREVLLLRPDLGARQLRAVTLKAGPFILVTEQRSKGLVFIVRNK
ncbi:jg12164 [Pararge aegeria aegeria]|uniref:Jg12164 protein n=1 Tax=Pararge aegeria aegeria TaxID=348720 RepID=A0A8S4RT98_9NEOP|nr:jg12164 [Pararge aegeria aegeria]